jgi:hypothetical protein
MSQNERKEMTGRNRGGRLRPANTPGLKFGGRCSGLCRNAYRQSACTNRLGNYLPSWSGTSRLCAGIEWFIALLASLSCRVSGNIGHFIYRAAERLINIFQYVKKSVNHVIAPA